MREGSVMIIGIVASLACSGIAGALGGLLAPHRQIPPPRIAVLDMRSLVESIASDPSLDAAGRQRRAEELTKSINRTVDRYASEGVVVLDASIVLRAPREMYVRP
jgi:hypothetical protein